jgi:hypothetical protein
VKLALPSKAKQSKACLAKARPPEKDQVFCGGFAKKLEIAKSTFGLLAVRCVTITFFSVRFISLAV